MDWIGKLFKNGDLIIRPFFNKKDLEDDIQDPRTLKVVLVHAPDKESAEKEARRQLFPEVSDGIS